MRKLKVKKQEEIKETIEEKKEPSLKEKFFKKADLIIYALFFILCLIQKEIVFLIKVMSLITVISIITTALLKNWKKPFVYKMIIFFFLCLLSYPFNLIYKNYFGG